MSRAMHSLAASLLFLRRRLDALRHDERGISAVEFALILPLMVTLYLGGVEISQAVSIDRKVALVASAVGDLVGQQRQQISDTDMSNIFNAAVAVAAPYPAEKLKVTVSSVVIDNDSIAKVVWSDALNTTKRSKGQTVTLPSVYNVPGKSVIWTEVSYDYKPAVGYVITGTITLKEQNYDTPRHLDTICREGVACS